MLYSAQRRLLLPIQAVGNEVMIMESELIMSVYFDTKVCQDCQRQSHNSCGCVAVNSWAWAKLSALHMHMRALRGRLGCDVLSFGGLQSAKPPIKPAKKPSLKDASFPAALCCLRFLAARGSKE